MLQNMLCCGGAGIIIIINLFVKLTRCFFFLANKSLIYLSMISTIKKDKELTKRRLINAVGDIIREQGYLGLGVNKIARRAGVDKRLIYRYFTNVDGLIETYVMEKDYWIKIFSRPQKAEQPVNEDLDAYIGRLITEQLDHFYGEKEMQGLIHWEISQHYDLLDSIATARELMGSDLLSKVDDHAPQQAENFRCVSAIIIAGIYYLVLHGKVNKSTLCEIDIHNPEDRERLSTTIKHMITWSLKGQI